MSNKFSNWTRIDNKFKQNDDLLRMVQEAKRFLEPKREREIREIQLTTHGAKCNNHTP